MPEKQDMTKSKNCENFGESSFMTIRSKMVKMGQFYAFKKENKKLDYKLTYIFCNIQIHFLHTLDLLYRKQNKI